MRGKDIRTNLPIDFVLGLPEVSETWLIASDEAERIANEVFEVVKRLREIGRTDIQFLLTSRDTDWGWAKADRHPWNAYTVFVRKPLRSLHLKDANTIVAAWSQFGPKGLGRLSNLNNENAAQRLFEEAQSEESPLEGAFLGGMLRARYGEGLVAHVKELIDHLASHEIPKTSLHLVDAFKYIAAMHAENLPILQREVLADVLVPYH